MKGKRSQTLTEPLTVLASIFSIAKLTQEQLAALSLLDLNEAQQLVRFAYPECKSSPLGASALTELVARAKQSDLSIATWVSEILMVYRWLELKGRSAKFLDILEYIGCAFEGSSLQPGHSIEWYLENYGFSKS